MDDEQTAQVYRVTVRGRFGQLTDAARRYLVGAVAEHDIFLSGYTVEGTFTYDEAIDFFNLRFELRAAHAEAADELGRDEAARFLRTMGFDHRELKVEVIDMSAMWSDAARRSRRHRT